MYYEKQLHQADILNSFYVSHITVMHVRRNNLHLGKKLFAQSLNFVQTYKSLGTFTITILDPKD